MKVAQEKIVVPTSTETEIATEDSGKEKIGDESSKGSSDASDVTGGVIVEKDIIAEAPSAATEPTPAPEANAVAAAVDGVLPATAVGEGEDILGTAKEWGSFLFGGVKDVTMKVTSSAANATEAFTSGAQILKKTVEENTILGDFNRQQEKFLEDQKETNAAQEAALPPWMGYAEDEENLKEQILALASDERHFLRPPPGGVSYQFDYETSYPIALATLEADPILRDMRFKLVPKKIKEEEFWRNYFYRVSLIKQSVALHSMSTEDDKVVNASGGGEEKVELEKQIESALPAEEEDIPEWEKELQRELQEYEVVGEADGNQEVTADPEESEEWQEEIQKMLEQANVDESPTPEAAS